MMRPNAAQLKSLWRGREDIEVSPFAQRWHQAIAAVDSEPGTVLLGFACDAGVARNQGRTGAALGPNELRKALCNVALSKPIRLYDAGNVECVDDSLEAAQSAFAIEVTSLLKAGHRVIGIGGGHEIAWGCFSGLLQAQDKNKPTRRIGIINFDAHFDLRAGDRSTSGTPFRQISQRCEEVQIPFDYLCLGVSRFANTVPLFDRAKKLGVQWRLDEQMISDHLSELRELVQQFLRRIELLYLTFCLDVLPPSLAPGVSAPSARGVELQVIEPLLELICQSGKLRLADIAELNPAHDIAQITARVAARLVARIVETWQ